MKVSSRLDEYRSIRPSLSTIRMPSLRLPLPSTFQDRSKGRGEWYLSGQVSQRIPWHAMDNKIRYFLFLIFEFFFFLLAYLCRRIVYKYKLSHEEFVVSFDEWKFFKVLLFSFIYEEIYRNFQENFNYHVSNRLFSKIAWCNRRRV